MTGWAFTVLGRPAPQGSKSFKGIRGGKAIMVEASKYVRPWRDAVRMAAPKGPCLDGPIAAFMVFTMHRPVGTRRHETTPHKMPDLSKLVRSTEDACTDAGLWADDGRVAEYARVAKVWTGYDPDALQTPGAIVAAVEMDEGWHKELHELIAIALCQHEAEWAVR